MTILYVNGDSHTAAAEAVNPAAFAEDDGKFYHLGRQPHPDNLAVSWCTVLAQDLGWDLVCDAESASSNDRIIRTTRAWLNRSDVDHAKAFVILQWSTWEREEWWHLDQWYQVNASGQDSVPPALRARYREFVQTVDWRAKAHQAHAKIWDLHHLLKARAIPHVFFNGNNWFDHIDCQCDWGNHYLSPYHAQGTFHSVLAQQGFSRVNSSSYHYGLDAHCFWAKHVLQYMRSHNFLDPLCVTS